MTDKACLCIGANQCLDTTCKIMKECIEKHGEKFGRLIRTALTKVDRDARIEEYSHEVIPMFDGLFTDGEYRKSFYNAVERRITELKEG